MPCCYRVRLVAPLSVFLALVLSISPVLSCYAYAEGSPEGQEMADERPEEHRAVGSGDEPREGAEEPEDDREAGSGAEEGEAARSVLPEVPSGAGSSSGGSAVSGVDGTSEDAYSSGGRGSESPVSDELGIQPYATTFSVIDTLVGSAWSGEGTQFVIGSNKIAARNGTIIWAVLSTADILDSVLAESKIANNYLQASDSSLKSLVSLLQKQWGYGYGGTVVLESNSPAALLQGVYNALYAENTGGKRMSIGAFVASIFASAVNSEKSLASVDSTLSSALYANNTGGNRMSIATFVASIFASAVNSEKSLASVDSTLNSALFANNTGGKRTSISTFAASIFASVAYIDDHLVANGSLLSKGFSDILAKIDNTFYADNTGGNRMSVATFLSSIFATNANSDKTLSAMSVLLQRFEDRFISYSTFSSNGFADLLSKLDSSIGFDGNIIRLLTGLQESITAWGARWDNQDLWFIEWGKHWESQEQFLEDWLTSWYAPDLSESNKLLGLLSADVASIRDMLALDYARDVIDMLLGDLKTPATAAALSSIQDAMGKVFPFCVPSIVNLVLFGSVVADPEPPCWEFDIAGSPLVVDFADYEDFAEVCRWTVRLMFTVSLLFGSRRFIYGMGGDD